ncbi:hypothetical protein [Isoptericola dokdonensis]|jgi:hypothetical protein|uniref:Uncharacterized protein n=1 Tax=Isoptericola dokdonensis DS-3 TaxID=1300344 RepID=A0A168G1F9_9MICO|nr:hypothetical protein [Isoptericola dokdonensis]ANC32900.1 hypothetical protein I598_3391 [Isoptericola dokdonensis DS-3]
MTVLLILVLLTALAYATVLVRAVRLDGHGRRPVPRSHRDWDELPTT